MFECSEIFCYAYRKPAKNFWQNFECFHQGTVLNQVRLVRYLGVIIDSSLLWSLNITSVVSRVRSIISFVLRYGTLPPLVLCLLCSTFVLPLFDYCDVVWTPITAKLTASLERVHSKFVKRLLSSFRSKFSYTLTER